MYLVGTTDTEFHGRLKHLQRITLFFALKLEVITNGERPRKEQWHGNLILVYEAVGGLNLSWKHVSEIL